MAAVAERPVTATAHPGEVRPVAHLVLRWVALASALALDAFTHLYRLGTTTALLDELTYQQSGLAAVRGTFTTSASPYLARWSFGLSQVVLGEGLHSARLVGAIASMLTGVVLFAFGRRLAGWWVGVGALTLWAALPQATQAADGTLTMVKLGRSALLEPVMALFVLLAVALCWRWVESGRLRDALLVGVAVGAAVASKPTAALVAPVLAVAGAVGLGPSRRLVAQVVALGVAAVAVVALSYAPLGDAATDAATELVEYQVGEHAADGHQVIVAGTVADRAPWWAYLWWQWRSLGTAASVGLGVGAVAASAWAPRRGAVALLAGSILAPAAYLSFVGRFGLPHYLHLWQPMVVLLATLGLAALVARTGAGRALGVGLVALLAVVGVQTTSTVATTERHGYGAVPPLLERAELASSSVVVWGQTLVAEEYLSGAEIVRFPEEATRPIVAVIVDPGTARRDPRPQVEAYLVDNAADLDHTIVDQLDVFIRRRSP